MFNTAISHAFNEHIDPNIVLQLINEKTDPIEFEALSAGIYSRDRSDKSRALLEISTINNAIIEWPNSIASAANGEATTALLLHQITDPQCCPEVRTLLEDLGFSVCFRLCWQRADRTACAISVFTNVTNEYTILRRRTQILGALCSAQAALDKFEESGTSFATEPILTDREAEVLTWTARGKTTWEIATILSLSESTINFHLRRTMDKLRAVNKCNAASIALSERLITL